MKGNQVQKKGGTLKAVICFIVGLILGIAIVVGTVAGGVLYVLNSDLDNVLSMFGVDNSVDSETGRNKIINTDPEQGGADKLMDLISKVTAMASNTGALTLGQIDELIPATRGLVDSVAEAIQDYVAVDFEELSAVVFSEFGTYLQNKVMEIQPAAFLNSIEVEGAVGTLLEKVLFGVEAYCVTDNSGTVHPLMLDTFTSSTEEEYIREEDSAPLLPSQKDYLIPQSGGKAYNLYFYEYNGGYYIAEINHDDSSKFIFAPDDGHLYGIYSEETAQSSGNYYVGADGKKVTIDPITIGSLADGSGLAGLEQMRILDLLSSEGAPDELLESVLGDIMIGDLMDGTVDFGEKVNGLELGAFLEVDPFENSMLLYFAYGLTGLSESADSQGRYTATYKLGEEDIPVYVTIENGKIDKITNAETGEELPGTTVGSINSTIDNIEISIFVEVTTDNGILPYLAYGITGIKEEDGVWTATLNGEECTLNVDPDGKILSVTNNVTGKPVPAAGINDLSGRVNGVMDNLTIGDIIDVEGNKILEQLAESKISELSTAVNTLEISGLIEIPTDNKILAYLAYGITEINGTKAKLDDEEVDLTIEGKNITGVTQNGEPVPGTKINEVGAKVNELTSTLKIKDIVDISDGGKLMEKIGDCTISGVGDVVNDLTLSDVMDISSDNKILAYLAYGITEINGKKAKLNSEEVDLTIEGGNITGVTQNGEPVPGTKINAVGTKVNELTSTLKIKDIIDIPADDKLLSKIGEYEINNVSNVVDVLEITDVMSVDANSVIMAYLAYGINQVDVEKKTANLDGEEVKLTIENGNITAVTKQDGNPVPGTKVGKMSERITGLMNTLTIGELITVDDSNTILNAIKDATINTIGDTISSLTLNELYADEIYKVSSYEDKDGNGQYDPNIDGEMTYTVATLRKAVSGEPTRDDEIKFDAKYLYYTKDEKGSYHLVEGKELGKLDSLDGGEYYTYGEVQGMWTLLLTDESGAESALVLNGIGGVITGVADRLNNSTLRELDAAGILDFESAALDYQVDFQGTKLGDLKLTEALSKLVDLVSGISGSH